MAGIGCDDALIRGQYGIDDHGIGLRAAREEINLAIRGITGRQYLLAGAGTDVIRAIAGHLHRIVVPKTFQDKRMRALHIVAGKRKLLLMCCGLTLLYIHTAVPSKVYLTNPEYYSTMIADMIQMANLHK